MLSDYGVKPFEFNLTRLALQVLVLHCHPHMTLAHILGSWKAQTAFSRHTFQPAVSDYLRVDHNHPHWNVSSSGAHSSNAVDCDNP